MKVTKGKPHTVYTMKPKKVAATKAKIVDAKAKTVDAAADRGFDINKRYTKKSDLEHVLLRPDTYVGGTDKVEKEEWVVETKEIEKEVKAKKTNADIDANEMNETNATNEEKVETETNAITTVSVAQILRRKISFSPALLKILDEILVNARDHTVRDPTCNKIKVTIDETTGEISVENNGEGIAVEMHEEGCYLPELVFGHFKTGENFEDEEKKTVGGRNGFGAKLSCAFSKKFEVDTVDAHTHKRYVQLWEDNMSIRHNPKITSCQKTGYTKITFIPDFKRLGGTEGMEHDFFMLAKRRVYDMAACTRPEVLIYFNGEKLPVRTFEKYINLYIGENKTDIPRIFTSLSNEDTSNVAAIMNWEIGVALSDDGFKHVSFVNGIATSEGGTHVAYIRDQLVRKLGKIIRDKNPNAAMKPEYIRENLWIFLNAVVLNPAFSSQTKESLTTKPENFGFKHNISDEIILSIEKRLKISKRAIGFGELRMPSILKRTDGKKKKKLHGFLKLEDAKHAGGKRSGECTLIVTEGDSAKTMAMDGLQLIGRDLYGVFPLKGKPLNTRNATNEQLLHNEEYSALKQILGLEEGAVYTDPSQLRYGSIMLMTDQDLDGYHIKGLSINDIFDRWPSILKNIPGFFKCFVTPIVKLQPISAKSKAKERLFFNMSEFNQFRAANPAAMKGMKARYLKGLGTSERNEALAYFADFKRFVKEYRIKDDKSLEKCKEQFEHAFTEGTKYADWRKQWLSNYDENAVYDYGSSYFALEDYVDNELKHFSIYSNQRAIGHVCDGLKISQRKILWALMEMGIWNETKKVLAVCGEISSKSSYHHGEKSLMETTIGMAQTFVDSNNVNLLYPSGQFGSRLSNGRDASDARYIYTKLSPITKYLYRAVDNKILRYETDDEGKQIEPKYYAPIIAMVLINGCDGIGTGYSTTILKYHPLEVIDAHNVILKGGEIAELTPWYRNFRGTIVKTGEGSYMSVGLYERTGDTTIVVTEVPVGTSFEAYKQYLESHLVENAPATTEASALATKRKKTALSEGEEVPQKLTKKTKKVDEDEKSDPIKAKKKKTYDKSKYFIKEYESASFPTKCRFEITFTDKETLDQMIAEPQTSPKGLFKKLKLTSSLQTSNMYLFTPQGIQKFNSVAEIIRYYHAIRLNLYAQRKEQQLQEMQQHIAVLDRKRRFIQCILDETIIIRNRSKSEVASILKLHNLYDPAEIDTVTVADVEDDGVDNGLTPSMKELLRLNFLNITKEEVAKFLSQIAAVEQEYETLKSTPPEQLWLSELEELRGQMVTFLKKSSLETEEDDLKILTGKIGAANKSKAVAIKRKK